MKETIENLHAITEEKTEAYRAALKEAKDIKASRQKKIQEVVNSQNAEIEALKAKRETANDERGEAIIAGDTKKEAELDAEIALIDKKIAEIEQKLTDFGKRSTAQAEKDAVTRAVAAHREKAKAEAEELIALCNYIEEAQCLIDDLEKKILTAKGDRNRLQSRNIPQFTQDLVQLYETTIGKINVYGHKCLHDEEAKHRFICGISRGLEGTVAAALLEDEED